MYGGGPGVSRMFERKTSNRLQLTGPWMLYVRMPKGVVPAASGVVDAESPWVSCVGKGPAVESG